MGITVIGTICHNDDNPRDPNHRRIVIWMDGKGVIWADPANPHRPDAPKARDFDDAVRIASRVWSGPEWDFEAADPPRPRAWHRWNGPLPDVGKVADDPGYFG